MKVLQFHALVYPPSPNVHINSFMLKLEVEQSQTNQICIGKQSPISTNWKCVTCSVAMLEQYMAKAGMKMKSTICTFAGLTV